MRLASPVGIPNSRCRIDINEAAPLSSNRFFGEPGFIQTTKIVSSNFKRRFFRRIERWLVGAVMAAIAYLLEKAVTRSASRGGAEPKPRE
jgi:hypothetical protein